MATIISIVLTIAAAIPAILAAVFLLEVVAGILLARRSPAPRAGKRPAGLRLAVLVPAHDESSGLTPTLSDIRPQLVPGDRLVVVADNCTDDTAAVAAAAGAAVIERHDELRRGKDYALRFGLRHLADDAPDIVIMVDADCRLAGNAINELAAACAATQRPVQALYLMTAPAGAQVNLRVAEFAWRVKNWLRPLGLKALGLPCQLMGTGMAFPWRVIVQADLGGGALVEDLKLGLELTEKGHAPFFCPSARVASEFAAAAKSAGTQRKRWEQGHITTILSAFPALLGKSLIGANWGLLALAVDLAVPPLSLLAMLTGGIFVLMLAVALAGFPSPALIVSALAVAMFVTAGLLAWRACGRDVVPAAAILSIAGYALRKFGLYRTILFRKKDTRWIRTDRTKRD